MIPVIWMGILSGGLAALFSIGAQWFLNLHLWQGWLESLWFFAPLVACALVYFLYWILQLAQSTMTQNVLNVPVFVDLFQKYHFRVSRIPVLKWFFRGFVSFLNTFMGGTFGIEGSVLEWSIASTGVVKKKAESNLLVICCFAGALSAVFSAPFAALIITMEFFYVLENRLRIGAIVSAFSAYAFTSVLKPEGLFDKSNLISSLSSAIIFSSFDREHWIWLGALSFAMGFIILFFGHFTKRVMGFGVSCFKNIFTSSVQIRLFVLGVLMSFSVWAVPSSFLEMTQIHGDLSWLKLTVGQASLLLIAEWVLFVLAFCGFSSTGIFTPLLLAGGLIGYIVGNIFYPAIALPLTIIGAATAISTILHVPFGALVLVLELTRSHELWLFSILSVGVAFYLSRVIRKSDFSLQELVLRGFSLRIVRGRVANVLQNRKVSDVMSRDFKFILQSAPLHEIREAVANSPYRFLGVIDDQGFFIGTLWLDELPMNVYRILMSESNPRFFEIKDWVRRTEVSLMKDESLEKALEVLQSSPLIPILDEHKKLCGYLTGHAIHFYYEQRMMSARAQSEISK